MSMYFSSFPPLSLPFAPHSRILQHQLPISRSVIGQRIGRWPDGTDVAETTVELSRLSVQETTQR